MKHGLIAGLGVSGAAAARALLHQGFAVTVVDRADDERARAMANELDDMGAHIRLGDGESWPEDQVDLLVTSPGWRPDAPLIRAAQQRGVPVWGEVELAWQLRPTDAAPWLAVTGTNGKTTTVTMLASMLTAAGLDAVAAGNVGTPLVDVVAAGHEVIAVELSSFQLHWSASMRAQAAVVLNVADDHLDWHGSLEAYAREKGRVYSGVELAAVYNVADPTTRRLVEAADVGAGARAIGFTLQAPGPGELGVVEDLLVDRAFGPAGEGVELGRVHDVIPLAPHNIENALAAAALARAHGVPAAAVRAGLRAFRPGAHRVAFVADVAGVRFVDDSKATNPHAAAASLGAYAPVVWIAGGLAKGAHFDDLVRAARDRLRGVVLIGADRAVIADALARHAPDVPVVEVANTETGAMREVVSAARGLAAPGDTVLLAPACASMDMFTDYAARGDAFAAAVRDLEP